MAIPKYDEIIAPVLKFLKDGKERQLGEFETPLAEHLGLSAGEINEQHRSGPGKFYANISFALSFLHLAGLLNKPERGAYQINEGLERLENYTEEEIASYVKSETTKRNAERNEQKKNLTCQKTAPTKRQTSKRKGAKIKQIVRKISHRPKHRNWNYSWKARLQTSTMNLMKKSEKLFIKKF